MVNALLLDAKRARKPLKKLRKRLNELSKSPPAEQVHDLRTSARRMQATFEAQQLGSRGSAGALLRKTAKLRRRAGKVRDMDVLTGYLFALHDPGDPDCMVRLAEHLGAKRYRHAKKLRS